MSFGSVLRRPYACVMCSAVAEDLITILYVSNVSSPSYRSSWTARPTAREGLVL